MNMYNNPKVTYTTNLKSSPDRYFKNPRQSQEIMEEQLERLFNILTSALYEPLKTTTTVELRHDVLRRVTMKVLPLNTKIRLEEADFDPRYFPEERQQTRGQFSFLSLCVCSLVVHANYIVKTAGYHSNGLRNRPFLVSNKHIDEKQ